MLTGRCHATAVTTVAVLAVALLASGTPLGAKSSSLPLGVLLTVSPELSNVARRTLISETARIWRQERVELRWPRPAGGTKPPEAPLRVLVISRPDAAAGEQRWPVAELVSHEGHRPIAIASITSARRVIAEASRYRLLQDHPADGDYRLGLVLGRAVAHEIGHYLLRTDTHAMQGLMRASIDAQEFADPRSGAFRLDEAAQAHMATLAARGLPAIDSTTAAFSYATP